MIVGGSVAHRPLAPIGRDRTVNNIGIGAAYSVFTQSQARRYTRPIILYKDIGIGSQLQHLGNSRGLFEINLYAVFVSILCTKSEPQTLTHQILERAAIARQFTARRLNLYHLSAK